MFFFNYRLILDSGSGPTVPQQLTPPQISVSQKQPQSAGPPSSIYGGGGTSVGAASLGGTSIVGGGGVGYLNTSGASTTHGTTSHIVNNGNLTSTVVVGAVASGNSSSNAATAGASSGNVLSEVEAAILRSTVPIDVNETEEITVNGERGIWANKTETLNFRGVIPISHYAINDDPNPEIIRKKTDQKLVYQQEVAIRYLRPPTPPPPGSISLHYHSYYNSTND